MCLCCCLAWQCCRFLDGIHLTLHDRAVKGDWFGWTGHVWSTVSQDKKMRGQNGLASVGDTSLGGCFFVIAYVVQVRILPNRPANQR